MRKCIVPWTQIEVCATGFVRPCAEYKYDFVNEDGSKTDLNDANTTLESVWNNHEYTRLRQQYINGEEPDGCSKCFTQESQGILSRRQREMEVHGKHLHLMNSLDAPNPVLFDVKLGNHCNLQCKICNSEFTKKWEQTELEIFGQVINPSYGKDWVTQKQNWDSIVNISENLEVLYLSGGEPFLINDHYTLLDHLIETDRAKNIWIKFHTNGSFKLTNRLLEIFSKFQSIQLHYSIDDVGANYEYQRPPAKWRRLEENFKHAMQQDVDVKITYTVGLLNSLSGTNMEKWCDSIGFDIDNLVCNFLHDPIFYNISLLDRQQKNYLLEHLGTGVIDNEVRKFMETQHLEEIKNKNWRINSRKELDNLRKYVISKLDSKSKVSLMDVNPVIAKLVNANENMCLTT
jgi:MoaA/NifB/PqqE/SkfB family radical SAM enzyme